MKKCCAELKVFQKIGTNEKSKKTPVICNKRGPRVCSNFLFDRYCWHWKCYIHLKISIILEKWSFKINWLFCNLKSFIIQMMSRLLITKLFKYLILDKGTWLQASKVIIYLICCTIWHEFVSFQKYLQLFYFSAIFMTLRNVYPERLTSYAVQNLANYTILVFIIGRIHAGFLFTI